MIGDKEAENDDYINFQAFLDIFGTWNNETFFDTRRIMYMVSCGYHSIETSWYIEKDF